MAEYPEEVIERQQTHITQHQAHASDLTNTNLLLLQKFLEAYFVDYFQK